MKTKRLATALSLLLFCSLNLFNCGCTNSTDADSVASQNSENVTEASNNEKDSNESNVSDANDETAANSDEGSNQKPEDSVNDGSDQKTDTDDTNQGSSAGKGEFEMQELEQLSSPFTKERVIMLNAIVRKSLDIINEYDGVRRAYEKSDGKSTSDFQVKLKEFSKKALAVREEMAEAKKDLVSSGEKYNEAIFAGMVKFVHDVDNELRNKIKMMEKNNPGMSEKEKGTGDKSEGKSDGE